ncbi:MAG TPA: hypothetical protein DIT04_04660 [Dysgonomonas sp.]|nr:hypothetical protein [Dysgonomonas sp.]
MIKYRINIAKIEAKAKEIDIHKYAGDFSLRKDVIYNEIILPNKSIFQGVPPELSHVDSSQIEEDLKAKDCIIYEYSYTYQIKISKLEDEEP